MEKSDQHEKTPHGFISQLKSFVSRRHVQDTEVLRHLLSDKNTFFAWQRNHMANERTFLAWCRTGISLIVFSFVIERFDLLIREFRTFSPQAEKIAHSATTHYLGLIIFTLGAAIMLLAGWRFFDMRRHINQADPEFSTLPDIFLLVSVLVTLGMVFLLFAFLF
jgi:putative membrane protein